MALPKRRRTMEGRPVERARKTPLVLVADDDQDLLDLVVFRLERSGIEVMAAADGEQALALVHERVPDCAVLDIVMPKLDGIQVVKRLRSEEATKQVPILLLTARTRESDVVSGLEAGADDYVKKPFSPLELLARVRKLLELREHAAAR
jgi:DNA-binding response OmpR family regulator